LCWHLPLAIEIALVADDNHGEVVLVFYAQDLLLEGHNLLEALAVGYRVDEQEALAGPHVLLAHGRVLLLAGCVEHIEQRNLVVNDALLAVRVCGLLAVFTALRFARLLTLNGRVVFVDKVALDQLDGQAGLAHASAADYDQLVLSEKLRAG
jgi:hypothetical protein